MSKPHVHSALIKQWADGAKIEYKSKMDKEWNSLDYPGAVIGWHDYCDYRVKPEPKPDIVLYAMIEAVPEFGHAKIRSVQADIHKIKSDTCKFVFDRETGELKDVQLLAKE